MKDIDTKRQILRFFYERKNKYVSGEEISASLGFSRASLWKHINKLRLDGYLIEAVPHLGYTLKAAPDKMYGYDVGIGLGTDIIGKQKIWHYESLESTNNTAYELAEKGEPEGTLVVAETQTLGKGRLGRKWISPKNGGIYFSLILRPEMESDKVPVITLVAAVSVQKAIKKVCGISAGIKWPNDILIGGKKVCGILTELKAQPDMVDFLILGVGINVNTEIKKLPPEATSLKNESSRSVSRIKLMRRVLTEMEKDYQKMKNEGFMPIREECKKLSTILNKQITVKEYNSEFEGFAKDIDEKGALIVQKKDGTRKRVFSGDVCRDRSRPAR
ncbi:MAG: biotin--[acetyl-CoA-carboxylase] ligase [Candidatus Omnitrophica bacterium]|nr:biotin--[acetyl-CoA-carboxylase] ligase [Candidatus Omnitrophota bacterium]